MIFCLFWGFYWNFGYKSDNIFFIVFVIKEDSVEPVLKVIVFVLF